MAPELFTGAQPSKRTEIYALGVTIYEFVTGGQHPYIGPETGGRFLSRFRTEPLRQISSLLGIVGRVLPSLVALDPSRRPGSFHEVLGTSHGRQANRSVFDIAIQASTLRKQRRLESAHALLAQALKDQPEDPVLLNGLSFVLVDEGKTDNAEAALRVVVAALRRAKGRYQGDAYVDPAINLARESIRQRRFADAAQLLLETSSWVEEPIGIYWYAEFGWTELWCGNFSVACEHFARAMQTRQIADDVALGWFVLAAHLGRRHAEAFVEIGRRLTGAVSTPRAGSLALLVSNALRPPDRAALINSIPDAIKTQLGMPPGVITGDKAILGDSLVLALLRSIDDAATGGKYSSILERPPG
jgi:hypothetical protein